MTSTDLKKNFKTVGHLFLGVSVVLYLISLKSAVFIDDDKRSFEGWTALIFGWIQEPIPSSANLIYFFLFWPILDNQSFFQKPFFRALLIVLAISGMILAAFTFEVWKLSFDTGGSLRPVTLATGAYVWMISLSLIFLYTLGKISFLKEILLNDL